MNYYPSISEDLLKKALRFARQFTVITDKDLIMHCRKSVLIGKDGSHWIKKANGNFDVAMGSYDSAEVCNLVGLFYCGESDASSRSCWSDFIEMMDCQQ